MYSIKTISGDCCTSAWILTHNTIGPFSNSVEFLELFDTPAGPKLEEIRAKIERGKVNSATDRLGGVLDLYSVNAVNGVNADPTWMLPAITSKDETH